MAHKEDIDHVDSRLPSSDIERDLHELYSTDPTHEKSETIQIIRVPPGNKSYIIPIRNLSALPGRSRSLRGDRLIRPTCEMVEPYGSNS